MLTAVSAYAESVDWHVALEHALTRLATPAGANLGFIYLSEQFAPHLARILHRLRAATGVQHWVGASACGIIGSQQAALDAPAISLLVCALPANSFRIFSGRAPLPHDFPARSACLHTDPQTLDLDELILDMAVKLHGGNVFGGIANGRQSAWQVADSPLQGGLSGVVFDARIKLVIGVSQGYTQLAEQYRITDCEDYRITGLNGQAALKVFRQALSPALALDLRRASRQVRIGLISEEAGEQHIHVRDITDINVRDNSLTLNTPVQTGQTLCFVQQDANSAEQSFRAMLQQLHSLCPNPSAALNFSCLGRGGQLFERDDSEVQMIHEQFGPLPLAGCFAAGEIAHNQLYGLSSILVLLSA